MTQYKSYKARYIFVINFPGKIELDADLFINLRVSLIV